MLEKYKKILWDLYATQYINNKQRGIGNLSVHIDTIKNAKKITIFKYHHC